LCSAEERSLEQHVGEKMMTAFSFLGELTFKEDLNFQFAAIGIFLI